MEHDGRTVELSLDLVFNIHRGHQDSTKVAGDTTPRAAPHAKRNATPKGSHVQTRGPRLGRRSCAVRRN
jgi:hypothetical protein